MGLSFDIKSFNFITWDWGADVSLEEAKKKLEEYEKKDLLCELGEVVVDDYECEDFEKSSTPARIIEDE